MKFNPEHADRIADILAPGGEAARAHADRFTAAGFGREAAGRDYAEQGERIEQGIGHTIAMLTGLGTAFDAHANGFRWAAAAHRGTDGANAAAISGQDA